VIVCPGSRAAAGTASKSVAQASISMCRPLSSLVVRRVRSVLPSGIGVFAGLLREPTRGLEPRTPPYHGAHGTRSCGTVIPLAKRAQGGSAAAEAPFPMRLDPGGLRPFRPQTEALGVIARPAYQWAWRAGGCPRVRCRPHHCALHVVHAELERGLLAFSNYAREAAASGVWDPGATRLSRAGPVQRVSDSRTRGRR
jgi:hypothetical protein